jgi:hypothetical protein
MGDVIPNRATPPSQEKPDAKPFAHFVAGGYVSLRRQLAIRASQMAKKSGI